MTIEKQINNLNNAVGKLSESVISLNQELYLKKINDRWSPRDIIAHLAGWNRHIIKGCRQIINGELPFYDIDPGENYCNVNAVLIREYSSEDKQELIKTISETAQELAQFLQSIEPDTWDRDFGVKHAEQIITIRDTVDELIEDYVIHTRQIEEWRC
ncbi:MAG: DinB family protein [bacterium]|nr:DinB family protein [bacterium]